ncbi:hypothetical protein, partial [Meiothermus luteus]|uniref:hypothetical protein n=1 Tax=Meiothermus luteus TaxID=2026184 RepID=UPI0011C3664C
MPRASLFALLCVLVASCAAPPGRGVLELEVVAPQGVRPRVVVRGPEFERWVETGGPVRLSDLAPGTYSVEA